MGVTECPPGFASLEVFHTSSISPERPWFLQQDGSGYVISDGIWMVCDVGHRSRLAKNDGTNWQGRHTYFASSFWTSHWPPYKTWRVRRAERGENIFVKLDR